MEKIKQKHYADLELDCSEKDIIQIWMNEPEAQVVMIERNNIQALIDILEDQLRMF